MSSEKPADGTDMAGAPPPYTPGNVGPPPAGAPLPYPPGPGFNPATAYPPQPGMPQPGPPPPGSQYPPPGSQYPPPGTQYMQQTVVPPAAQTITVTAHQAPMVALIDQCPNCKLGSLHEQFTPLGIICAIFFFPIGLICCLMSRHKMCPVCGTVFHGR